MCGRYAIPEHGDIPVHFKGTRIGYDLKPRYNAAPSEDLPAVVNTGENHVEINALGTGGGVKDAVSISV
jgi:putative SOS response-associated peptidase YedK